MRLAILCSLAIGGAAAAQPYPNSDAGVLIREHRAHARAIALADLAAARGSEPVKALGRHVARDARLADDQLGSLVQRLGFGLDAPRTPEEIADDQTSRGVLASLSRLDGIDFDRALLSSLAGTLDRELARIDVARLEHHATATTVYLDSMRPILTRYSAEAGWLARSLQPAS